jgi:hypothetical protein
VSGPDNAKSPEKISAAECQTCKSRKYQDGSNDPGCPSKRRGILILQFRSVVRAHEQEHVFA